MKNRCIKNSTIRFLFLKWECIVFIVCLLHIQPITIGAEKSIVNFSYDEQWTFATEWKWSAAIPVPSIRIITTGNVDEAQAFLNGIDNECRLGFPSLPCYSKILNITPAEIRYSLHSEGHRLFSLPANIEIFNDIRLSDEPDEPAFRTEVNAQLKNIYPAEIVHISFIGYQNGIPLSRIKIYPYQIAGDRKSLTHF